MSDNGPAGITFHATFNFNRSRMAEVIAFVERRGTKGVLAKDLAETSLGKNMWPAFLEWGRILNLLERADKKYRVTPFGRAVLDVDPLLASSETMWLLHFQIIRKESVAPRGWYAALHTVFSRGLSIDNAHVASVIENAEDHLASTSIRKSTQVLLNSYSSSDGFGNLGLIRRESADRYYRSMSNLPLPLRALESMLIQWWDTEYRGHDTVLLSQVRSARELSTLLGLDPDETEDLIEELHRNNRLDVLRGAPPYHVLRYWNDDPNVWIDRYASNAGNN